MFYLVRICALSENISISRYWRYCLKLMFCRDCNFSRHTHINCPLIYKSMSWYLKFSHVVCLCVSMRVCLHARVCVFVCVCVCVCERERERERERVRVRECIAFPNFKFVWRSQEVCSWNSLAIELHGMSAWPVCPYVCVCFEYVLRQREREGILGWNFGQVDSI